MPDGLPPFPPLPDDTLLAIARRHGTTSVRRLPQVGIFNAVFVLGEDLVLRIPRNRPDFVAHAEREAIATPAARRAGVRTPALVAFDDSRELLPVPYVVHERVHGDTLELLGLQPEATPRVWRELGRDYARLHHGVLRTPENAHLQAPVGPHPREYVDGIAKRGAITHREAAWLHAMLERLDVAMQRDVREAFCHGDSQGTNVMVGRADRSYLALIDWGSATWADPARELMGLPLRAVPRVLEGYREVAPFEGDDTAEARVLWWQLHNALLLLDRPPLPDLPSRSWAERPLAQFVEIMRFLLGSEGEAWRRHLP